MLQLLLWCHICRKHLYLCRKSTDCGGERLGPTGGVGAGGAEPEERWSLDRAETEACLLAKKGLDPVGGS